MDIVVIIAAAVFIAVLSILYGRNKRLRRQLAVRRAAPYKAAEERQDERLRNQLEAVMRDSVEFSTRRVMGQGEYNVFCAAMNVTGQPFPPGSHPVWVFPQVALGQIIRTSAPLDWQADHAHQAINSKRCDLLLADRHGNPIAVVEYQGTGHDLGGTAERRDRIKRIALERAGVRVIEIPAQATGAEIRQAIRDVLSQAACDSA